MRALLKGAFVFFTLHAILINGNFFDNLPAPDYLYNDGLSCQEINNETFKGTGNEWWDLSNLRTT
jgi:hypothetical protein